MGYCYQCDRCGKMIDSTAYHVAFRAVPVQGILFASCESTAFNLSQALIQERLYCRDCIEHIQSELKPLPEEENLGGSPEEWDRALKRHLSDE